MEDIAKQVEKMYELNFTENQTTQINELFRLYMREWHFPASEDQNKWRLKLRHMRKAYLILSEEQLAKYSSVRLQNRVKQRKQKQKDKEKGLMSLDRMYAEAKLSTEQLEVLYHLIYDNWKRSLNHNKNEILKALEGTLSDKQKHAISDVIDRRDLKILEKKVDFIKNKYSHLKLTDSQAKSVLQIRDAKGYIDISDHKEDFREILSAEQFVLYMDELKVQSQRNLVSLKAEDDKLGGDLSRQNQWCQFIVDSVLPIQCKVAKELYQSASQKDRDIMNSLRMKYLQKIKSKLITEKSKHIGRYDNQLPNRLKLNQLGIAQFAINIQPKLLDEIDLDANVFEQISISSEQKEELARIWHLKRNYQIAYIEDKIGSYAGLMVSQQSSKRLYSDLYTIVLLHNSLSEQMKIWEVLKKEHC